MGARTPIRFGGSCATRLCLFVAVLAPVAPAQADVVISSAATKNMSCSSGVCAPTAKQAVLNVGDLTAMLASGNVEVNTGGGKLAKQVKDIVVAAGFNWTSASALTLSSYNSITFNKPVVDNGPGAVTLTTDDGDSGGVLYFGANGSLSFAGTANSLTIDGAAYTLESSIQALAVAINANRLGNFALAANYDATQDGAYTQSPIETPFSGTLQGLGNTISNLSLSSSGNDPRPDKAAPLALFEYLYYEGRTMGTVNGLVVKGLSIQCSGKRVCQGGGIAWESGNLFNDTVSGTFEGNNASFGGLAVGNVGSIISSSANVTISEQGPRHTSGAGIVGGLVAGNGGVIEKSNANGSVSGTIAAGGLVGEDAGTIDESFSTATVAGGDDAVVGGLVGLNDNDYDLESNSYATGAVSGGSNADIGGFIGHNNAPIEYSYSTGAPSGGTVGKVGGFAGSNSESSGTFSDSYWDTTTSGMDQGTGSGNDAGLTGLTTAQLQAGLPAGFDTTIWAENPKINGGLPYLIANPPPK